MMRWDNVKRTPTDMDFGETALGEAAYLMKDLRDTPQFAICPQSQRLYVEESCKRAGIKLFSIPDAIMNTDSWIVVGERSMIWSSGA